MEEIKVFTINGEQTLKSLLEGFGKLANEIGYCFLDQVVEQFGPEDEGPSFTVIPIISQTIGEPPMKYEVVSGGYVFVGPGEVLFPFDLKMEVQISNLDKWNSRELRGEIYKLRSRLKGCGGDFDGMDIALKDLLEVINSLENLHHESIFEALIKRVEEEFIKIERKLNL